MKICIHGRGFAGLAACWFALNKGFDVSLNDPNLLGDSPSGIAAGLLHPFPGKEARYAKDGFDGVLETIKLLDVASAALGKAVYKQEGMLRLALHPWQLTPFYERSCQFPNLQWWEAEQCQKIIQGVPKAPGLFIREAISVNTENYLKGLFLACLKMGVKLGTSDGVQIYATGSSLPKQFPELPLKKVKGQLLILAWPKDLPPLPFPINSRGYLVMNEGGETATFGATFERIFFEDQVEEKKAIEQLLPKISELYPPLLPLKIIDYKAGVRVSAPEHTPFFKEIKDKTWVFSGLGSKGLLYHALFAKKLIADIFLKMI